MMDSDTYRRLSVVIRIQTHSDTVILMLRIMLQTLSYITGLLQATVSYLQKRSCL